MLSYLFYIFSQSISLSFVFSRQRLRENITERDGLVPIGPEPSFQAPHQPQELIPDEDDEGRENDDNANNPRENENENPEERFLGCLGP